MMWHATAFAYRKLRRADLQPPIDLNGIEIDDLPVKLLSYPDCQIALPSAGRAKNHNER